MPVRSYRDLRVWKEAMNLVVAAYSIAKRLPKEEKYELGSQIRCAAVSVPANVAEGHGREQSGSFVQFLRMAQGSLKEIETHLLLAERVGLGKSKDFAPLLVKCDELGRMLRSLIRSIQRRQ